MKSVAAHVRLLQLCRGAVQQIRHECKSSLAENHPSSSAATDGLGACDRPFVDLLSRQASQLHQLYESAVGPDWEPPSDGTPVRLRLVMKRLDDILSIAYSKFYCYLFHSLPVCWRQLYTDASILKFCLQLSEANLSTIRASGNGTLEEDTLTGLVKTLDLALILAGGAGEQRGRRWINEALEQLAQVWSPSAPFADDEGRPTKRTRLGSPSDASFSTTPPFQPRVLHPIRRASAMSMEAFQSYMENPRGPAPGPEPIIMTGLVEDWPARTHNSWDKPFHLLSRTLGGRRLVPVEIGRSYVDEGWGQKLITFGQLLHDYIDPSVGGAPGRDSQHHVAYLAQHPLFTQLPSLRSDIRIPDLCYTSPPPHPTDASKNQPEVEEPLLNAWFGPPGTITPLHNDPYHNLLVQVVGYKYVRLYSPTDTKHMYARGKEDGVEMGNTSMVDVGAVEGWDQPSETRQLTNEEKEEEEQREAKFSKLAYLDCILGPGDTLYIPIGWWHYVRGLSVSFSVSFWWN